MMKIIIILVLFLSLHNLKAQTPDCTDKNIINKNKSAKKWPCYTFESLFSTINIYFDSTVSQLLCDKKYGLVTYVQKSILPNSITVSKTIVTFSFENFSSCLIFLQYKNFNLTSLQKYFARLKAKYQYASGPTAISSYDFYLFQKKYFTYVNGLSKSEKDILEDYINFFENRKISLIK